MSAAAKAPVVKVVQVYRDLLRTLRQHVMPNAQTTDWTQFVGAEFRRHQHLTDGKEIQRLVKIAQNYKEMLNAVADHQRLMLKYGWGVPRSQRDEIERMVSRVGLRTPMPPEYMEFHEKQKQGELESLREARNAAIREGEEIDFAHHVKLDDDVESLQTAASSSSSPSPTKSEPLIPVPASTPTAEAARAAANMSDDEFRRMFRSSGPNKPSATKP